MPALREIFLEPVTGDGLIGDILLPASAADWGPAQEPVASNSRLDALAERGQADGLSPVVSYDGISPTWASKFNSVIGGLVARYGTPYDGIRTTTSSEYAKLYPDADHSPLATLELDIRGNTKRVLLIHEEFFQDDGRFDEWLTHAATFVAVPEFRGVVAHEYGHLLSLSNDWNVSPVYKVYRESGDHLSKYADTSADEMIAEAFACHETGKSLPGSLQPLDGVFERLVAPPVHFDWNESLHPRGELGRWAQAAAAYDSHAAVMTALHKEIETTQRQLKPHEVYRLTFPNGSTKDYTKASQVPGPTSFPKSARPKVSVTYAANPEVAGLISRLGQLQAKAESHIDSMQRAAQQEESLRYAQNPEHAVECEAAGRFAQECLERYHIPPEQSAFYHTACRSVFGRMTEAAVARFHDHTDDMKFFSSKDRLTEALAKEYPEEIAEYTSRGLLISGGYSVDTRQLYLDGDNPAWRLSVEGVYAHEMSHAIDGPKHELSNSADWEAAWKNEIKGRGPSRYAGKNTTEGFAEFGRLALGGYPLRELERSYPACAKFWQERGLLQKRPKPPADARWPEYRDKPIPVDAGKASEFSGDGSEPVMLPELFVEPVQIGGKFFGDAVLRQDTAEFAFNADQPRDEHGKWVGGGGGNAGDKFTTGPSALIGDDGEVIKTPGGRIDVRHKYSKFSPRKQSVIDFVVDEDKRGQGIGDKLLKEALKRHADLGGQVSSPASLKVFHNNGFRNPEMPNGTFEDHLHEFNVSGGSLYMAHKDENGQPYTGGTGEAVAKATAKPEAIPAAPQLFPAVKDEPPNTPHEEDEPSEYEVEERSRDWLQKLTATERAAVRNYTATESISGPAPYEAMNSILRGKEKGINYLFDRHLKQAASLQDALLKAPKADTILTSYRGLHVEPDKGQDVWDAMKKAQEDGTTVKINGFQSSSRQYKVAGQFGLTIAIKSRRLSYVESVSKTPGEDEIIHPHGCTYKVTRTPFRNQKDGQMLITLEEQEDHPPQPISAPGANAKFSSEWSEEQHRRDTGGRFAEYEHAGKVVDGREVLSHVPNEDSIEASLTDYKILPGIRQVPMAAFDQEYKPRPHSKSEAERLNKLQYEIEESKSLKPLIVVIDKEGPYILEGGHRYDALHRMGAKAVPAKVVIDTESAGSDPKAWNWKYKPEEEAAKEAAADFSRLPDDAIKIEGFPELHQTSSKTYACGAVALEAVARHFNVGGDGSKEDNGRNEWWFEKHLGTTYSGGTNVSSIVKLAKKIGLVGEEHQPMSDQDLRDALDARKPVICCLQAWGIPAEYPDGWDSGHYIVAIGYTDDLIVFEDPWLNHHRGFMTWEQFAERWHDEDADGTKFVRWGLALSGPEEEADHID